MNKNPSVLHMKGIHTPEIFIWFHGLWHGKIIHSGGLDPETNCIASAYVTAQIKNFRNACILRFEKAESQGFCRCFIYNNYEVVCQGRVKILFYPSVMGVSQSLCKPPN